MAEGYVTEDAAVAALRPGWKIVGRAPYQVETDNPAATKPGPDGKIDPLAPKTIKQTLGTTLSIEGPNGEPDTLTVSTAQVLPPGTTGGGKAGVGYTVITGPSKGPPAGTNKASDPTKWTPVYRVPGDASSGQVGTWDPVNNDFHAVAAAPDAKATGKYDPVVITDPNGTQRQVGMVDTGDKSFHPLAAPPDAKASGSYDNQYVTNADGTKRLVGMVDTGDKHFIPVSADPTTQKRTIQTPTAIYSVDDNDNVKKLVDIDKNVPLQAVIIDGKAFSFDPNEKDPSKRFTPMGADVPPATLKQGDDTLVRTQNADGSYSYGLPPGVTRTPVLNTNTTAKTLDYYDPQTGKLVSSTKNPNYVEPKVDQPTLQPPNTTAPMIMVADPDHPGQTKWIKNEGRVTASQALQQLASQLSGHVVDNTISVDEAKQIIDGANAAMTAQANAAQTALQATNQAAQTGAGLLQNRVSAATGALNQFTSEIGSNQNIMKAIPGLGANLVGGLSEWVTGLGGGKPVYDAAAAMVKNASPEISGNPTVAQQAYAALRGLMDLKAQKDGTLGQGEVAPPGAKLPPGGIAGAGAAQTGFTASQTNAQQPNPALAAANQANAQGFNPQASTAALNARGLQDTPQGRALAMAQAATVTPGQYNPAYQQAYPSAVGMPAMGPIVGQVPSIPIPAAPTPWYPGAPFVAPQMV